MNSLEAFNELVDLCNFYHHKLISNESEIKKVYDYPIENIRRDLEILEIIKKYPDIVNYCDIYKNAYDMIYNVPGFMFDESVSETVMMFNKVKDWLEND